MIEHALAQNAQARIIGKPCERRFAVKVKRLEPAVRQPAARDRDRELPDRGIVPALRREHISQSRG